jgi:tol-pal system protein YbgF
MPKKIFSGMILILGISVLFLGAQKKERTYELIYKDIQLLKQQILQMDRKIEKNQDDISVLKKQMEEILSLVRLFQREQADMKEEQNKMPAQYQALLAKLDSVATNLSRLSESFLEFKSAALVSAQTIPQQGEEAGGEDITPPENTKTGEETDKTTEEIPTQAKDQTDIPQPVLNPTLSAREVYNMAYTDYRKGNYQLSIDGFQIYLEQFPESPLADNALYWIGECYFSQENYETAVDQFNQLILQFPEGDKMPAAYLKKGISLVNLDREEEALSVFRLLISKFPLEEETKIAQEKIKEIIGEQ